jgi:hypothetical protein
MGLKKRRLVLPYAAYKALCVSVYKRDGWKCRSCKTRNNLHAHHIIYRSAQGDDADWNLITLCSDFDAGGCHEAEHRGDLVILAASGNPHDQVNANGPVKFQRRNGWKPQ